MIWDYFPDAGDLMQVAKGVLFFGLILVLLAAGIFLPTEDKINKK